MHFIIVPQNNMQFFLSETWPKIISLAPFLLQLEIWLEWNGCKAVDCMMPSSPSLLFSLTPNCFSTTVGPLGSMLCMAPFPRKLVCLQTWNRCKLLKKYHKCQILMLPYSYSAYSACSGIGVNNFSGSIPAEIGNCTKLVKMWECTKHFYEFISAVFFSSNMKT